METEENTKMLETDGEQTLEERTTLPDELNTLKEENNCLEDDRDLATYPTTTNDAMELTHFLRRNSTKKIKELEQIIKMLLDIPKSQDQTKRALREALCQECREKSHNIFKSPFKTFSGVGCQTECRFSEQQPSNNVTIDLKDDSYTAEENSLSNNETFEPDRETQSMTQDGEIMDVTNRTKEKRDSGKTTLQEENARMKQEIAKMNKKLTQSNKTMDQLQEENRRLNDHRQIIKKDLRDVQEERDTYQTKLKSMQDEIDTLRNPVDGSLCKGMARDTTNTSSKNVSPVGKSSVAGQNAEKGQTEDSKTKANAAGESDFELLVLDVGETKEKLEREKEQMDSKKKYLQENIDTRESVIQSLRGEKEKQALHIERLKQEKQNLEQSQDKLQTRYEDLESEVKKTKKENQNLVSNQRNNDEELKSMKYEKTNTDSQMKRVQEEKKNLQNELDKLHTTIVKIESELTKTQKENRQLIACQTARANELRSINTEKDKLHAQIVRIQQEKNQNQDKMNQTESALIKAQNENRKVTDALGASEERLRTLQKRHDQLKSETKTLQQERHKVEQTLEEKVKSLTQEKKKSQDENMCLKAECGTSQERLRTLQTQHDRLKSETKTLQQENDQIKQTLEEKLMSLTHEKKKAQDECMCLKAECNKQNEELRKFKQQLEVLKKPQRKHVVLGLRSEKSGLGKSLVDMVTKGLTKRLQERLDMSNLNLIVSFSQNPSDVTNGFQIVLCLNMSRVGTNIADSLKGMKVDRDVFVMVLHHTNKENLSALTPTSHRVTGNEVRQLGGILDMAFSSDGGLYECDLNNVAVEKIALILKKCLIF
ncbi:myosin-2 heavy chain, non muscle-like [Pecten maximus]|uniref:myosin-2 heavy chain, non muscle-like n=1 Tax=Pecten maximus TaxID=6579 RepID=UPI001459184E|nr:myosin-2 heavy chain, non muscle-like [Pecten maximus]